MILSCRVLLGAIVVPGLIEHRAGSVIVLRMELEMFVASELVEDMAERIGVDCLLVCRVRHPVELIDVELKVAVAIALVTLALNTSVSIIDAAVEVDQIVEVLLLINSPSRPAEVHHVLRVRGD